MPTKQELIDEFDIRWLGGNFTMMQILKIALRHYPDCEARVYIAFNEWKRGLQLQTVKDRPQEKPDLT